MNHPIAKSPDLFFFRLRQFMGLRTLVPIVITIGVLAWLLSLPFGSEHIPDFSTYTSSKEKKSAFFGYLEPRIARANAPILEQRRRILKIRQDVVENGSPGWLDESWLQDRFEEYEFEVPESIDLSDVDDLLSRVDIIPPSLIMAQAANESAWGTSRFARQGNNFFGMRTNTPGAGIVPKRRAKGAVWEVAAYDSVSEGISAYIHTLNTNQSYLQLRLIRRELRRQDRVISGSALAAGLLRYSEKGHEYISLVRAMISSNDLGQYDE